MIATGLLEQRKSAGPLSRRCIDALLELTDRYRLEARKRGDTELAQVLEQVPRHGARSFGKLYSLSGFSTTACGWRELP